MTDTGDERPTRLVLVRHGESNVTVERVIGGVRTCSGLSALGRRQSERLAQRWLETSEVAADVLVSSDFPRAIETAELIGSSLGAAVSGRNFERLAGFGEHDPGPEIDGMSFTAYVDRFGTPDWSGDPHADIFPGGETTAEFHDRVDRAFDDLLVRHASLCVVVACHGGVIDALMRRLVTAPMTGGFQSHTLNTSITEFVGPISPSGVWRLVRYNDAAHLAGLPSSTNESDV
jgi:broad specificity phosphatase PhoE